MMLGCKRDNVAVLQPIHDDTCICDIPTDMVDVMLSTAAKLGPLPRHPRRAQDWCAGPGVKAEKKETMTAERGGWEPPACRTP